MAVAVDELGAFFTSLRSDSIYVLPFYSLLIPMVKNAVSVLRSKLSHLEDAGSAVLFRI
jgi:hypothetical protein